jgi:hypothetical protein
MALDTPGSSDIESFDGIEDIHKPAAAPKKKKSRTQDPPAAAPLKPTEPEPTPEYLQPTTEIKLEIADSDEIDRLSKGFVDVLEDIDAKRGTSLSETFQASKEIYNTRAVMRRNVQQMQFMLQEQFNSYLRVRDITEAKFQSAHKPEVMKQYLELNHMAVKMTTDIKKTLNQVNRELRLAEKDSRDNYHVSTVMQFLTGLTAILVKHLQDSPKRQAITSEITKLARIFQLQER